MTTTADDIDRAARRRRATGLAVLLTGTFMAALDASIANVAAPAIESDLGISGTALVLALSGYTLSYAMLLVTGARLGDDYGHRRLFVLGLAGFTAASLACGLAPSGAVLIVARVLQGAACAFMTPQVATIIQLPYQGAERARALALFASVLAVGVVSGQILGGLLVSADLFGADWRPVFLVNVPIGIALVAGALRTLGVTKAEERRPLDLLGVALVSATLLLILVPLVLGREQGWPAWMYLSMVSGLVLGAVAAAHFRAVAHWGGSPLVDPRIVSDAGFGRALASLFASTVAWGGFLFAFTVYLQAGLDYSALESGLIFVPYGVGFAVASLAHNRLPARLRPPLPAVGLLITGVGYVGLGLVDHSGWHPVPSAALLALAGAGYGVGFSPVMAIAVASVPARRARDARGILSTAIQMSYAVGLTLIGSYFLAHAAPGDADRSGHAFTRVTYILAALSLVAAALAGGRAWSAVVAWRRSRLGDRPLPEGAGH